MTYGRRLVFLICPIAILDTLFAAAAGPLIPGIAGRYGLSKTAVGVFVAAHSGGALVGGLLAAVLVARVGVKKTLLGGLLLSAMTSAAFGLSHTPWELTAARFGHGVGSSLDWVASLAWIVRLAPGAKRGWVVGVVWGATQLGSVLGPATGGAASRLGIAGPFITLAILTLPLAAWVASVVDPGREDDSPTRLIRSMISVRFAGALWLTSLPAVILGTIGVLVPLQLGRLGWTPIGIATIYALIGISQIATSLLVGRLVDRLSVFASLRAGLIAAVVATLCLTIPWFNHKWPLPLCALAIFVAVGLLLTPSTVVLSREAEATGVQQGTAFALANISWAPGAIAGAVGGGAIASAAGDGVSFGALAVACVLTLIGFEYVRRTAVACVSQPTRPA